MNKSLKRYQFPALHVNSIGTGHHGNWESVLNYRKNQKILEYLPPTKYTNILNLGGSWTESMVYDKLGYNCTSIVLSEDAYKSIDEAGFKVILNDICDMIDIKNNSMDAIVSAQSLEHVYYPWKALFEIYRILKDTGRGFINVPTWLKEEIDTEIPHYNVGNSRHCSVLFPCQYKTMMRSCGFKIFKHDIHLDQQNIYFDKIPLNILKDYPETDLQFDYYRKSYNLLKGYCSL